MVKSDKFEVNAWEMWIPVGALMAGRGQRLPDLDGLLTLLRVNGVPTLPAVFRSRLVPEPSAQLKGSANETAYCRLVSYLGIGCFCDVSNVIDVSRAR